MHTASMRKSVSAEHLYTAIPWHFPMPAKQLCRSIMETAEDKEEFRRSFFFSLFLNTQQRIGYLKPKVLSQQNWGVGINHLSRLELDSKKVQKHQVNQIIDTDFPIFTSIFSPLIGQEVKGGQCVEKGCLDSKEVVHARTKIKDFIILWGCHHPSYSMIQLSDIFSIIFYESQRSLPLFVKSFMESFDIFSPSICLIIFFSVIYILQPIKIKFLSDVLQFCFKCGENK